MYSHGYFVIRDHPFADGNKRIGTLLFLEYLRRNGLLLRADGEPRLADNAVVALALLVAQSNPKQKELMVRSILNLLEDRTDSPDKVSQILTQRFSTSAPSRGNIQERCDLQTIAELGCGVSPAVFT